MKHKILVTGGAGYVGAVLTGLALEQGYQVRVVDKLMYESRSLLPYFHNPHFEFVQGDLREPSVACKTLEGIDAVIHLAAIVGDPACSRDTHLTMQVNFDMTKKISELAKEQGIKRFIFSSTCSNYGVKSHDDICTEDSTLNPVSEYARSKVLAEQYLLESASADFHPTILRFSTVFGTSSRMRFDLLVNHLTRDAVMNGEILVYGEQFWRPYLHVFDFGRAMLSVLESDESLISGEVFNVGSNNMNFQKRNIAALVKKEVPFAKIKTVGMDEDPRSYCVDFSKINKVLGFEPSKSVEDGIREIIAVLQGGIIQNPFDDVYKN